MKPRKILAGAFRAYKRFLSPLLPPACRFQPTCSEYAAEAVERHGAWRGLALALWRLARCHPWSRGGFDPVPTGGRSGGMREA
jgi:putative membrane protein insertion efficiency factor